MPTPGPGVGWTILALVFVDEVLAVTASGVWGWQVGHPRVLLVVLLPLLVLSTWWAFASPKAPYGGRVARPAVKVVVFGLASVALWHAGHPAWAVALLVFSVAVNGLALLPGVQVLVRDEAGSPRPRVSGAAAGTPRPGR